MKKYPHILMIAISLGSCTPQPALADLFGGDVAVLTQILVQTIQQVTKLKEILGNAQANLDLVREINRGINDSLSLLRRIEPNLDPGLYRDWHSVSQALHQVTDIYGKHPESPLTRVHKDTDQSIAEAIAFNNAFYQYSRNDDAVGEAIKQESHRVSPGGASKLSAQALGLIIQVLNQNLRAQSTGLKLQAQALALENRRDKERTRHHLETTNSLVKAMKAETVRFELPRF